MIGLAPSAAAAAVLGEQTGIRTDTLAKLTWSLRHGELPDWAAAVGPSTLLIIDEAGMADTLTSRSFEVVKVLPTEKIYGTSYTASTSSTSILIL